MCIRDSCYSLSTTLQILDISVLKNAALNIKCFGSSICMSLTKMTFSEFIFMGPWWYLYGHVTNQTLWCFWCHLCCIISSLCSILSVSFEVECKRITYISTKCILRIMDLPKTSGTSSHWSNSSRSRCKYITIYMNFPCILSWSSKYTFKRTRTLTRETWYTDN